MVQFASLEELAETLPDEDPCAEILIRDKDEEKRILGILMKSIASYRKGNEAEALETLLRTRESLPFMPTAILAKIIELAGHIKQEQRAAHECVAFARDATAMGYDDLALEAASAAMILDALGHFEITRSPQACAGMAALYESIACRLLPPAPRIRPLPHAVPLRVALVVPNLVDYVVAYTKRILHFARYLDPKRYTLSVYVSENLATRKAPVFPFGCQQGSSTSTGTKTLRSLRDQGIPVFLCPNTQGYTESARHLATQLGNDQIDIAIFQTGLACPIDWLAARLANIPVKLGIHIGCTLFVPGMDATFFDNTANLERESGAWKPIHGERIHLSKGADLAELNAYPAFRRAQFGIPDDAVIIGALSNHLPERLTVPYMSVLADILQTHPSAWLLFFGAAGLEDKMDFFKSRGVESRVRFGGKQSRAASALKVLDIYANEFPVGGSQSVIEAMACGLPVATLKWSDAHAESVATEIVGAEFGITTRDTSAYTALIAHWIEHPHDRHEAGRKMSDRASLKFSANGYVHDIMTHAEIIYRKKHP